MTFSFLGIWRYEPDRKRWLKVNLNKIDSIVVVPEKKDIYAPKTDKVLVNLLKEIGLFYIMWEEDGKQKSGLVCSGPIKCNDIRIGESPKGMIATCVPFKDRAESMFIPDPKIYYYE